MIGLMKMRIFACRTVAPLSYSSCLCHIGSVLNMNIVSLNRFQATDHKLPHLFKISYLCT